MNMANKSKITGCNIPLPIGVGFIYVFASTAQENFPKRAISAEIC